MTSPFADLQGHRPAANDQSQACIPIRNAPDLPSTDDMLASTAHELRLPLSHIKGFVSSLRRTDIDWDDETRCEFLTEIELEADRLANLIDSLIAVRETGGGYKPPTDLALTHVSNVIRGAIHRTRGLLRERPLRVEVPPRLPPVRIDVSQMERVLANLIHNAVKYSSPGLAIGISARLTNDGEVEVSVDDEGPGIPVEDRDRIFEPFFRGQAARR